MNVDCFEREANVSWKEKSIDSSDTEGQSISGKVTVLREYPIVSAER